MITIDIALTLQSPLHIGSGAQQGTLAQRGMLKDANGWPYIPASTLKGRWRHATEQVAKGLHLKFDVVNDGSVKADFQCNKAFVKI